MPRKATRLNRTRRIRLTLTGLFVAYVVGVYAAGGGLHWAPIIVIGGPILVFWIVTWRDGENTDRVID